MCVLRILGKLAGNTCSKYNVCISWFLSSLKEYSLNICICSFYFVISLKPQQWPERCLYALATRRLCNSSPLVNDDRPHAVDLLSAKKRKRIRRRRHRMRSCTQRRRRRRRGSGAGLNDLRRSRSRIPSSTSLPLRLRLQMCLRLRPGRRWRRLHDELFS